MQPLACITVAIMILVAWLLALGVASDVEPTNTNLLIIGIMLILLSSAFLTYQFSIISDNVKTHDMLAG